MNGNDTSVNEIVSELGEAPQSGSETTIGDVVDSLGQRGFGPLLLVPALIAFSPLGGIPGVPTLCAIVILILAAQIAAGRRNPWLPGIITDRTIDADKLDKAVDKLRPVANWLDKWFHERLPRLVNDTTMRIAAVIVILLCLTIPPLELLPFASAAPMAAVAMFGLAMTVRDGALMLVAFAVAAIGVGVTLVN